MRLHYVVRTVCILFDLVSVSNTHNYVTGSHKEFICTITILHVERPFLYCWLCRPHQWPLPPVLLLC